MQRSFMAKLQSAVRPVAFVLLLCLCVRGVTSVLVPKNYTREWMSPVPTYCGFYRLEDNTADVLFLGSSHSYSGFCPQVLYNEYGITSYNLAMGNQSLLLNYYWLKEALKTQKPSAVVLEGIFAFHRDDSATNAPESANQKSLGYMHWSENRIEAIRALCEADPENYSWESFVPVFRYHDRWKELHEEDFTAGEIAKRSGLMGFSGAFRYYCRIDDYKPYERAKDTEPEEMLPLMRTYLDKITDLCKEKGIRLVLTLTPCLSASASRSAALCRYAEEKGLEFYDFNLASEIAGMQYDFAVDNADEDHPNIWGAQKVTTRLGELLVGDEKREEGQTSQSGDLQSLPAGEKAGEALTGHKDAQWEEADAVYQAALRDAELMHCKKIDEYISRLQDERYCVLISVKGDASKGLDGQSAAHLRELGLQEDLSDLGGDAYVAVIDGGEVLLEERAESSVSEQGSIRDGKTMFSIRSEGAGAESSDGASSIRIDGAEQSVDGAGINIVVVLRENCACFDKVSFDTAAGGEAACVR